MNKQEKIKNWGSEQQLSEMVKNSIVEALEEGWRNHLNEESNLLTETLVDADLDALEDEMEKNEKLNPQPMIDDKNRDLTLREFLNKPAEELIKIPKYSDYQYLVQELELYKRNSLLDIIKGSLMGKKVGFLSKFSTNGSQISGFAAYRVQGDEIVDIKTFKFNNANNAGDTLLGDLNGLISELLGNYRKVSWSSVEQNRANIAYRRLINSYSSKSEYNVTSKNIGGVIYYSIEKK